MVVSPAATGSVQSDTPPVSALTAVLRQGVEILVVVHPTDSKISPKNGKNLPNFQLRVEDLPVYLIVRDLGHMLDVSGQPTTVLVIIPFF